MLNLQEGTNDLEFVVADLLQNKDVSLHSTTLKSHDLLRESGDIVATSMV